MAAPPDPRLVLTMSTDASLLRIVRLAARSLADDAGLDLHELDDVALAVDELTAAAMSVASGDITITLHGGGGSLHLTGAGPSSSTVELSPITASILAATTDEYRIAVDEGVVSFAMSKHHAVEAH